MNKAFCGSIILTLVVSCSCQTLKPKEDRFVTTELGNAYQSNVLILVTDETGKDIGSGSGVVINSELGKSVTILTAAHVAAEKLEDRKLLLWGVICKVGDTYVCSKRQLKVVKRDEQKDLAVVAVIKPLKFSVPAIRFAALSPKIGLPVFVVSNPGNSAFTLTHGIVSKRTGSGTNTQIYTDAGSTFGSSGGGIYNYSGELVGIIQKGEATFHVVPVVGSAQGIGIEGIKAFLAAK